MKFTSIKPEAISENTVKLIGSDWMLITSGDKSGYNTMTASWGGLGFLWNAPSAFIFIRPQRHTFGFAEKNDIFTLSFFDENYRNALKFCGANSGRDVDKAKKTGLTPVFGDDYTYFDEAKLVLVCKKVYAQDLSPDSFIEKSAVAEFYPKNDFHRMYVGKITLCLTK